jgi:hypothetical protein
MKKTRHAKLQNNMYSVATPAMPTCLTDFVGAWHLSRTIEQSNGDKFSFDGQATFVWRETDLLYHESGQMMAPNGQALLAERGYIWQQTSAGKFDVLFEDNRFFHTFGADEPYAEHLCGDDHYVVNYRFNQWPAWESSWQVKGPRKDYKMNSRYYRE